MNMERRYRNYLTHMILAENILKIIVVLAPIRKKKLMRDGHILKEC